MSFFNLRRGGPSSKPNKAKSGANAPTESVDIVRKRAKHRLIGAAVLVLIGVVGFPLLFDSQPRPVPVDIAIDIPNKNTVRPLITAPPVPAATPLAETSPQEDAVAAKPAPAVVAPAPTLAPAVVAAPPAPAAPQVEDSARARALLEGRAPPSAAASDVRMVVQVGAYADPAKVREARQKLEKAGFKTYTQVVGTQGGERTRVRVGPFPSRAEAEQVASKIKSLGLPVTVLTL
jgi:DedD protein